MQMHFLLKWRQRPHAKVVVAWQCLSLHTPNVDTRLASGHFSVRRRIRTPECRRRPLQGMECSKCGVAFVATCEIWFGEGCHLKGPGSAVMTAPEHSLTQSHCLSPPPLYRCISPLSYLSFTHSLTPLSLSLTPRLPVALFIGLL